jgi:predicted metalloprotease with PDZ domain
VGYYDKGSLVALMMDAKIRQGSGGKAGLPDLFAHLWKTVGDGALADADIREAYRLLSGQDPAPFWRDFVDGRADLDAAAIEAVAGLRFQAIAPWESLSAEEQEDPEALRRAKAWTGLVFARGANGSEANTVQTVIPDSPAFRAGISYGAEVLAVDGWRTATGGEAQRRLAEAFGRSAEVLVQERGRVRAVAVKVAANPTRTVRIVPDPEATPAQRAAFEAWTGQAFPGPARPRKARRP